MGPQLLLDKSTLEALLDDEILFMCKHYFVVVAPIIILEILGDLKKFPDDAEKSVRRVCMLAEKASAYDAFITENCRTLLAGSLLGYKVTMDGRPIRVDGIPIVAKTGERGMFLDEPLEMAALKRWIDKEFTEAEAILAERNRSRTSTAYAAAGSCACRSGWRGSRDGAGSPVWIA